MCDYSLMHFPNRLATEGEALVVHRFASGSLGLASPADLNPIDRNASRGHRSFWAVLKNMLTPPDCRAVPAVCIPPGARLKLHGIGERLCRRYKLQAEEEVVFEQLTAAPNAYRDAIIFRNGTTLRVQELPEGLGVTVLSMAWQTDDVPAAAYPVEVRSIF